VRKSLKSQEKSIEKISFAGWMPTRRIRDVVLGLEQLFGDLIDFDDALNQQAAQQYQTNKVQGFC
jgi:ubiquitin-conjugating enzyme E2 F